jgi:hypothetical protein
MNKLKEHSPVVAIRMQLSFSTRDQEPPMLTGNILGLDSKSVEDAVVYTNIELMSELATIGLSEVCVQCNLLGALVHSSERGQLQRSLIITNHKVVKLTCPILEKFRLKKMKAYQLYELGCHSGINLTVFRQQVSSVD